jgi:hypothetical protein
VRGYWLVDPKRRCVKVWQRKPDGSFARLPDLSHEDQLTTPLLPDLTIQLTQLFA